MSSQAADIRTENIGRAIVLTLITIGVFGIQDALSKILVQTYSPFQITKRRYWGFAAFSLVLVLRQARPAFPLAPAPDRPGCRWR